MTADPAAAPFALWRLVQSGDSAAVTQLINCLGHADTASRSRAASALAKLPALSKSARGPLATALKKEMPSTYTHAVIAAALGGDAAAVLIDDPQPAIRYVGAMYLADQGTAADRPRIEARLSDADADVRVAAAFALLRLNARTNLSQHAAPAE